MYMCVYIYIYIYIYVARERERERERERDPQNYISTRLPPQEKQQRCPLCRAQVCPSPTRPSSNNENSDHNDT